MADARASIAFSSEVGTGSRQENASGQRAHSQRYDGRMSAARVRGAVDFQEPLRVDAGIDLGGRERGVAEQFLDRAQVAAAAQKMGREGMPQRMRRGTVGQAQRA